MTFFNNGDDPYSQHKATAVGASEVIAALAQEIRRVDGDHSLGAAALAEALAPFIAELATPQPAAAAVVMVPREPTALMVVAGFEAAFDRAESLHPNTRGTCKGAAEIARATWDAMLLAAIKGDSHAG